jgi:hypothetical protein
VRKTRGLLLFACALLACVVAGTARAALQVGVTEDAGKTGGDNGATFFATLDDVGLKVNRVSVNWDPANPTTIPGQADIAAWMPQAQAAGVRILFAVAPHSPKDLTTSPKTRIPQFAAFLTQLAQTFPTVKDYVIGNEPNQPRFWGPQYGPTGKPLAAAQYLPVLAASYDALKAVDPTINVVAVGLSPRGNDKPFAKSNSSRSPVRFLHDLGVAYRASKRTKPIMDELAFHPYPQPQQGPPTVHYAWPTAALADLSRIKQAVWDAFGGTGQPTFAETGKASTKPLRFDLDELGWQVAPLPALASLYTGTETASLVPVSEQAQADYYAATIRMLECDSSVRMVNFFHLVDESDLDRWQSGLERIDGSHRPSYDSVKQTIAQTGGTCHGASVVWRHATGVMLPSAAWGSLALQPSAHTKWRFTARAGEEAAYVAGVFKAGASKAVLAKQLANGRPKAVLLAKGTVPGPSKKVVAFQQHRLKPGSYVYAIRLSATMNPRRTSVLVSRPFRVGSRR